MNKDFEGRRFSLLQTFKPRAPDESAIGGAFKVTKKRFSEMFTASTMAHTAEGIPSVQHGDQTIEEYLESLPAIEEHPRHSKHLHHPTHERKVIATPTATTDDADLAGTIAWGTDTELNGADADSDAPVQHQEPERLDTVDDTRDSDAPVRRQKPDKQPVAAEESPTEAAPILVPPVPQVLRSGYDGDTDEKGRRHGFGRYVYSDGSS